MAILAAGFLPIAIGRSLPHKTRLSHPMRTTLGTTEYEIGWGMRPRPVVKWLLIINFAVFCLQSIFMALGKTKFEDFLHLSAIDVSQGYLWQFFTYMFLHADVLHLLLNLLMLWLFGVEVELALESRRFLQMYIIGGLVGGLLWYVFSYNSGSSMVGSSGAVYAVIIAFATLYPNRPITLLPFFILPVTILAKYLALIAVAVSVLLSIRGESGGVAHLAHLGGMAVGFLFVKALSSPEWFSGFQRVQRRERGASSSTRFRVVSPMGKKDEFIKQQIDPILDKIAEHGIQSLTREERRLLDEAKDRL